MSRAATNPWLGRDHVLVVQAARNLADQPIYAAQLWGQADDPMTAALYLIDLLMRERVEEPRHVVVPDAD
jgi:hypothetical protein